MTQAQRSSNPADIDDTVKAIFTDLLGLSNEQVAGLTADSGLFGSIPEFDSMAVATVLTEIEDRFGFVIDDADLEPEIFETYGALTAFVRSKLAS